MTKVSDRAGRDVAVAADQELGFSQLLFADCLETRRAETSGQKKERSNDAFHGASQFRKANRGRKLKINWSVKNQYCPSKEFYKY